MLSQKHTTLDNKTPTTTEDWEMDGKMAEAREVPSVIECLLLFKGA